MNNNINSSNEMSVKTKTEVGDREKLTYGCKVYAPEVDIFETGDHLTLLADVPGVSKDRLSVDLDKGVLTIDGKIVPEDYQGLKVLYSEYKVGHFYRQFKLSEEIDEEGIEAKLEDGILKVLLPKVKKAQKKTIAIS